MAYIHTYLNGSSGGTDGTLVSEGTGLSPITCTLNSTNNEVSSPIKLAIRCDSGYQSTSDIVIIPIGLSTTVSGTNNSGQAVLNVTSATGYSKGETIVIGTGGTVETKVISSISVNAITLTTNLVNTHSNGETIVSQSYLKWALAPDNSGSAGTFGDYGTGLTISSVVGATNTIFWIMAKSTSDEIPMNDISCSLQVTTTIGAV